MWSGTCKPADRLKHAFSCFFLLPNFACDIFEEENTKPWYFTALEATPQKFHCRSRTQRSGAGVRRSHVYPIDISRLKSGIRRIPPTSFGSPKNTRGVDISRGQVKYFLKISCLTLPPVYSRVKRGGCGLMWAPRI